MTRLVMVCAGILGGLGGIVTSGCAMHGSDSGRVNERGQSAASPSASASAVLLDAVLPASEGWRVFQLGARREALSRGAPEGLAWKALTAPSGPFRPVQVVWAQRGYFHLVDAASSRLCLYDADAALLSTHPLPAEFTPFPAGRAAVFRGADGAFTFVDYAAGEAWQYADRVTMDGGTTQWLSRGRVKLPAGVSDCAQPAGSPDLYCRDAAGAPLRFDGALNRAGLRAAGGEDAATASSAPSSAFASPFPTTVRVVWDAASNAATPGPGGWIFEAARASSSADALPGVVFRYDPRSRNWSAPTTPGNPAPAPKP